MANYHCEILPVSRNKGKSFTKHVNYISGEPLNDTRMNKVYRKRRDDVAYCRVILPPNAPSVLSSLQEYCDSIEEAEKYINARTAREFICSLPNELSLNEQIRIVERFIENNFTLYGLCAVAAIHEGRNADNPKHNNPHVHILVSTRTVGSDGFSKKKDREHDKKKYMKIWRNNLALAINRAYARNGLDIRVSHKSLREQGIYDREPLNHLSRNDWQLEQRGIHTDAGKKRRKIRERNRKHGCMPSIERELDMDPECSY